MVLWALFAVVIAYLLGSINFAVIFGSAFLKKDVRKMGSGNAGTTNVMRNAGFLPGALTFICDALKGYVACFIGKIIFDYITTNSDVVWAEPIYGAYLCGLVCMLGHVFPVFYQFKGGKGVATSVGIFAVCSPIAIILGLAVFAVSTLLTKYVSFSSLLATVVVVIGSVIFRDTTVLAFPQIVLSFLMGCIVFLKHKENIKRLINGTESKVGRKNKK